MLTLPDAATVAGVARVALGDPRATVSDWSHDTIQWQSIARTTGTLERYRGLADHDRPWSTVRKVLVRPSGTVTDNWKREAVIYASGMLEGLPGIRAPRCYRIDEGDDEIAIWLEDVPDTVGRWTVDRYATAAGHLGLFNGSYLVGRSVPERALLRTDWLRSWVRPLAPLIGTLDDPRVVDTPRVRGVLAPSFYDKIRRLHGHRDKLLDALDAQPQTFSHLDAWRTNLIASDDPAGRETVVIDWSVVGLAPPGQELAVLVTGSRTWLHVGPDEGSALERETFAAYLDGLRAAGWRGSEGAVRFAFSASAALWAGLAIPAWLTWFADPSRQSWLERKLERPIDEAIAPVGQFLEYALALGDEAIARLDS